MKTSERESAVRVGSSLQASRPAFDEPFQYAIGGLFAEVLPENAGVLDPVRAVPEAPPGDCIYMGLAEAKV